MTPGDSMGVAIPRQRHLSMKFSDDEVHHRRSKNRQTRHLAAWKAWAVVLSIATVLSSSFGVVWSSSVDTVTSVSSKRIVTASLAGPKKQEGLMVSRFRRNTPGFGSDVTTKANRQVSISCDVIWSTHNASASTSPSNRRISTGHIRSVEWWCTKCQFPDLAEAPSVNGNFKVAEMSGGKTSVLIQPHRIRILPGEYSLSLNPVLLPDSGEYYCVVNGNQRGRPANLRVQDVPGVPGRPLVMESSSRSANLSWAAPASNGNSQILKYIVFIREGSNGDWKERESVVVPAHGGKEESFQVQGLNPYTVYSFRVAASNSLGDSQPSETSFETVTLREAPSGKPVITAAQNLSSSSVRIEWSPPKLSTIHGEFLGYRLSYKPRDVTGNWPADGQAHTIEISSPNASSFAIRNLLPYTQYLVSLEVFNPEGVGPPTTVMVMTDEGVPSKPQNVRVVKEYMDFVKLSWQAPETPNGELKGYRLYFMRDNFTDVRSIHNASSPMEYVLERLQPASRYKVWLKAFTYKNEGDPSDPVWVETKHGDPSSLDLEPLELLDLTCDPEMGSIYLHWRQLPSSSVRLDHYYIVIEDTGSGMRQEFRVKASTENHEHKLMLRNLSLPYIERVIIKSAAKSPPHSDQIKFGAPVERSIDDMGIQSAPCRSSKSHSRSSARALANASKMTFILLIGAVVCSSIMLVLLTVSAFMYRRYFRKTKQRRKPLIRYSPMPEDWWEGKPSDGTAPLTVTALSNHIHNLRTEGNAALKKEYQTIKAGTNPCRSVLDQKSSTRKGKKRYKGVYLDGWKEKQGFLVIPRPSAPSSSAYVPSNSTFWTLVDTVAANLIVQFKVSADEFVDDEQELSASLRRSASGNSSTGSTSNGGAGNNAAHSQNSSNNSRGQWEKITEEEEGSWSRRVFIFKDPSVSWDNCGQRYLEIWRFNLCDSDMDLSSRFAKFVVRSLHAVLSLSGPTVIHCSPGASQAAGSFVALCALLRQVAATGNMSVFSFSKYLRHADPLLLQDEDQYAFIHDALHMALQQEKFLNKLNGGQPDIGFISPFQENLQMQEPPLEQQHQRFPDFPGRPQSVQLTSFQTQTLDRHLLRTIKEQEANTFMQFQQQQPLMQQGQPLPPQFRVASIMNNLNGQQGAQNSSPIKLEELQVVRQDWLNNPAVLPPGIITNNGSTVRAPPEGMETAALQHIPEYHRESVAAVVSLAAPAIGGTAPPDVIL